jgi:hypothetical protein
MALLRSPDLAQARQPHVIHQSCRVQGTWSARDRLFARSAAGAQGTGPLCTSPQPAQDRSPRLSANSATRTPAGCLKHPDHTALPANGQPYPSTDCPPAGPTQTPSEPTPRAHPQNTQPTVETLELKLDQPYRKESVSSCAGSSSARNRWGVKSVPRAADRIAVDHPQGSAGDRPFA